MRQLTLSCSASAAKTQGLPMYDWSLSAQAMRGPRLYDYASYPLHEHREDVDGRDLGWPWSRGPLTKLAHHWYRKCQYLRTTVQDPAEQPINLCSANSVCSKERPLSMSIRDDVLAWLRPMPVRGHSLGAEHQQAYHGYGPQELSRHC